MNYTEKLRELRRVIAEQGLDGFLVPRTDEYQGEYVAACAERLAWLTGFTGSAGAAIILADKAVVMSDGRYTIQLAQQVDDSLYALENSQLISPDQWLEKHASEGLMIGYDPKLHTARQIEAKEKLGIQLKALDENLIDCIWQDRPTPPQEKVTLFSEQYAGVSALQKIQQVQAHLKEKNIEALVLTLSDSIAWLLNIRGGDIPHIPVALSYAIVPADGHVEWFVDPAKITNEVGDALGGFVDIKDQECLMTSLQLWGAGAKKISLDPKRSSLWFKNVLEQNGAEIVEEDDPCIELRAQKNEAEQTAMKNAHVRDACALVKFLKWFKEEAPNEQLTELSVEEKLESFRAEFPEFREPSFSTIAGFGPNGAIVHYRATDESSLKIDMDNLLLLDSGAQYEDGTTDITRTVAVGQPTEEMRENFTLVLKGHIALARARFNEETFGKDLDALARGPLLEKGLDYMHGTGHGVGCYLSVHEEAAMGISPRSEKPLKPGMIISNEPGYYKEGEYGIRIENLVLVQQEEDEFYFETITLVPIDKTLIISDMLDEEETQWLNDYHARVYKILSPLLDDEHGAWLEKATKEL